MDIPSTSSTSNLLTIKQDEGEEQLLFRGKPSIVSRKMLPYHSLLLELHTLIDMEQEIWKINRELDIHIRQNIWILIQDLKLLKMILMLFLKHGVRSQFLHNIQSMVEVRAEQIHKLITAHDSETMCDLDFRLTKFQKKVSMEIIYLLLQGNSSSTTTTGIGKGIFGFINIMLLKLKHVHRFLQGNSSTATGNEDYGIFKFINVILLELKHLKELNPILFDPVKKQMQILEHILNYAAIIARKMTNDLDENLRNFLKFFGPWVNTAAAIAFLYQIVKSDESDERSFAMVFSSLQKFKINILQYIEAHILFIKALRPSNAYEILVIRNTVEQLIEMILEKFNMSMDDRFDMFIEGLTFWTALLVDPPKSDVEHEKLICSQIHLLLDQSESLIFSLCLGENVAHRRNTLLNDFLEKINKAKSEVKQLQVHQIPGLSWKNTGKENARVHFDLLLGNLQKKFEVEAGFLPFEKHLIARVHEGLSHLRLSILDIFDLQNEHKVLSDICAQASNIAYLVEYVTDFCLVSTDIPIWSDLMCLSNAIEKIHSMKTQVSKIRQNDQMCNNTVMNVKLNFQHVHLGRHQVYDATINDDFKVGFVEEEKRIIDCLVAGEPGLEIVVVIRMGGQAYDIKKVFGDILKGVGVIVSPEEYQTLTQEDLADKLRKCLMGEKYLIFLDDMWDAKAWFDFQESFPDNRNGSRILVTSRIHDVALKAKAKANCSIVELHPLSHEESWKLLQTKVFHKDCCPPTLIEIGKELAKNCKGLPLAIVVVAGLLKKDKNVESWKQICESLKPLIANEGCMDIVELSYKHLPDHLKPCFLYLGAFKEDQVIDSKQLIQYWIAEGFVQSDGIKAGKVVAKEYLMELASRNLIFVVERSSRNQIKSCILHDLLHQLCQIKFEEERFLLVLNNMLDGSSTLNKHYFRIMIRDQWGPFIVSKPIVPGLRSLLVSERVLVDVFLSVSGVISSVDVSGVLKELKLIRILDVSNVILTKVGFHYITQLIHLRLLAVNCSFPIPSSILNLLKLEVLWLSSVDHRVTLPSSVLKMPSLSYIFAESCQFYYIDSCHQLVSTDMSSPLSKLESLATISFYNESSFKEVAQSLQNILKLGLYCSSCFRLSSYFKRIDSLKLHLSCDKDREVISPSILDFPLTLKKLHLGFDDEGPQLSGAMISLIGKLQNLEVLKLKANFKNDRWDVEDDEFLQVKYFSLIVSSIQEWNVSDESFPCLQQLVVKRCPKLEELPARFGSITTLRRIEVYECSDSLLDSFQQIVDDQIDFGNGGLQYSIS